MKDLTIKKLDPKDMGQYHIGRRIRKKDRRHIYCKTCKPKAYRDKVREWKARHPLSVNVHRATWSRANREHLRTYNREYQRKRRARQSVEVSDD